MGCNYFEYKDKIAFHPGYYIEEIIQDMNITQEDFAKRLQTTPKNISKLINGEQSLSDDIAMKLARMFDTSVEYWLNHQKSYDALLAQKASDDELENEREVFQYIDYRYIASMFHLPDYTRDVDKQIEATRKVLKVSTLSVLKNTDLAVNFKSSNGEKTLANIIRANVMVQIACNKALQVNAPKFNKTLFQRKIEYALTLTKQHDSFFSVLEKSFLEAGVILVFLPNLKGSKVNGATKYINRNNIMLMINDRGTNSDIFWFTLFHEIGHIMNNDLGISFENETGEKEEKANEFAQNALIPSLEYQSFVKRGDFSENAIIEFSSLIDRDPGLVLGRLQKDKYVNYDSYHHLHHKYRLN